MRTRTKAVVLLGAAAAAAALLARRRHWPDFLGRVVLVTGGSRGLGLALAREFAAQGARVAICGRDARALEKAREDLQERGAEVYARVCDVCDRAQARELVCDVEGRFGVIDVLVNNAGTISVGPMDTMTESDYDEAMRVHYWGPLHASLAALDGMRRRRSGRIVNIASIGGKISMPHLLPYNGSKFALVGLSEGLRAELAGSGVYVTTVCPGLMRTGSPLHAWFKGRHRAEYAWFMLGDSLPLVSMNAEVAARRIVEACRRGQSEVMLSASARAAAALHGLFPGLFSNLLGFVNLLLPRAGGAGSEAHSGRASEGFVTSSFLTRLSRRAGLGNDGISRRR